MKHLSDFQFRALLNYMMMSDDVALNGPDRLTIMDLLEYESDARGFKDWVEAYHKQE